MCEHNSIEKKGKDYKNPNKKGIKKIEKEKGSIKVRTENG